jgi:hypothetical protein
MKFTFKKIGESTATLDLVLQSNLFLTATLGTQKSGCCSKVRTKWSLFTVCSYKIAISFVKLGLKVAVVDMWPLFRGGR